jgi:hypothetical protein
MNPVASRLTGVAAALAALFGAGALAGSVTNASAPGGAAKAQAGHAEMAAMAVRGLGVAENGLRVVVSDPDLARGQTQLLQFRVLDEKGHPVRDFDVEHTKRMHLILARRDLTGFQHLHPAMAPDGTWSAPVRVRDAGSYRLFADFSHDGTPTTLADDLRVDGAADLRPLPAPAPVATSDGGYDVRLSGGTPRAGQESELRFTISKDGRPVQTEPYLGAGGHLVALRDGDLAFLHVHPDADRRATSFEATFPTTGSYRLFLQFKINGTVQTAAFTQEVR